MLRYNLGIRTNKHREHVASADCQGRSILDSMITVATVMTAKVCGARILGTYEKAQDELKRPRISCHLGLEMLAWYDILPYRG